MIRAAFLILLICAFAAPAHADRYSIVMRGAALNLFDLGEIAYDADIDETSYTISASLRSGGILNWFERTQLTASASGRMENGAPRWEHYDLDHHYSRKHRVIAMQADATGAVSAEITPNYRIWGDPATSDAQRRASRDPLSTLMAMAVDVGQTRRCTGAYPTFDGRFHYLLELGGDSEIADYEAGGFEGRVLKCSLAYIAVAGFEPSDRGRRRIPRGEVWFALPEGSRFAPPVRIVTPLSAGGATIRLTGWRRAQVSIADGPAVPSP
jgi:hypothetical protein